MLTHAFDYTRMTANLTLPIREGLPTNETLSILCTESLVPNQELNSKCFICVA